MKFYRQPLTYGAISLAALLVLSSLVWAQSGGPVLATLHSFTAPPNDGRAPEANMAIGSGGTLYSTTAFGGAHGKGSVFSLSPPASSGVPWTETVLYSFQGGTIDGQNPYDTGVALGNDGVIYGLAYSGGTSGRGIAYSLTPPVSPGGAWTESVLYNFGAPNYSSYNPESTPVIGSGGVVYGEAQGGATNHGMIFSLTPPAVAGGAWTETPIYSFGGPPSDGSNPFGGLRFGAGGVLYGTTEGGGDGCTGDGCGTVFSLAPPATPAGTWTETVLYNFKGYPVGYGYAPTGGVAIGSGGVLYGTTNLGGSGPCEGGACGTVFSLTPPNSAGGPWQETILYSFTGGADGGYPWGGIAVGSGGVLYGTTQVGGSANKGVVFSLTPPGSAGAPWTETVLYNFTGPHGNRPEASVVVGPGGILYGTTEWGGSSGDGTVFALKP